MREIKFRAWTGEDMIYEGWNGELFATKQIIFRYDRVMQFTGMKDNFGKEIYEGDILKCQANEDYPDANIISDVLFGHDLQWQVRSSLEEMARADVTHGLPVNWGGWKSMEVIGNIYENPELLSNEQSLKNINHE